MWFRDSVPGHGWMELAFLAGLVIPAIISMRGPKGCLGSLFWFLLAVVAPILGVLAFIGVFFGTLASGGGDPDQIGLAAHARFNVLTCGGFGLLLGVMVVGVIGPITPGPRSGD